MEPRVWLFWAEIAQGVGSLLSVVVLGWLTAKVYQHTTMRDKLDFIFRYWQGTQAVNIACLNDPALQERIEQLIYGKCFRSDIETAKKYSVLFIVINQLQFYYLAYKCRVLSYKELRDNVLPPLRMFSREAETITYLLEQRGYPRDFRTEIVNMLSDAMAIEPQQPGS